MVCHEVKYGIIIGYGMVLRDIRCGMCDGPWYAVWHRIMKCLFSFTT